jgi:hypothetical protein
MAYSDHSTALYTDGHPQKITFPSQFSLKFGALTSEESELFFGWEGKLSLRGGKPEFQLRFAFTFPSFWRGVPFDRKTQE